MSLNSRWYDPIATESFTVAFLLHKVEENNQIGLTPLQINKLAYILHGWTLGIKDLPLFNNTARQIQAWRYGPVVVGIYNLLKPFGRSPVTLEKIKNPPDIGDDLLVLYDDVVSQDVIGFMEENEDSTDHLNWLYDVYRGFGGGQLIDMTHEIDGPWDRCRARGLKSFGLFSGQNHIPDDVIRLYYKDFAKKHLS